MASPLSALVYYIDPGGEEMQIAHPNVLFDCSITDGRAMMCSVLTLSICSHQGMGGVESGMIYGICLLYLAAPRLRDGTLHWFRRERAHHR